MRNISLTKRDSKGAALTWPEMDGNWREVERQVRGLAFPAHPSLSNADMGKLVVLKQGQAKLPEFDQVNMGFMQNVEMAFTGEFAAFQKPTLSVTFSQQLVETDYVMVTMRTFMGNAELQATFSAVTADDNELEFIIGADREATMANFKVKLAAWMVANNIHPCYAIDPTTEAHVCRIVADTLANDVPSNFWGTRGVSQSYMWMVSTANSLESRQGSTLLGALLYRGLAYTFDGQPRQYGDVNQALNAITDMSRSVHTVVTYLGLTDTLVRLPANPGEMLAGVGDAMNGLFDGFVEYSHVDETLTLVFAPNTDDFNINLEGYDVTIHESNFSDVVQVDGEAVIIPVCNHPLLGQLVGLHEGNAIISQDNVILVELKGEEPVAFNGTPPLLTIRLLVLDDENPGFVKKADLLAFPYGLLQLLPGYLNALGEGEPGDAIPATLIADLTIIQILLTQSGG